MPAAEGFGYEAGGDIGPAVFVMRSTTEGNVVLEATAGAQILGISQRWTRNPPYSSLDDGLAAIDGEGLRVFIQGEVCGLLLGAAVTAGDRLKATTDGKGIAATSGDEFGAVAHRDGVEDEIIEVTVERGVLP